MSIPTFTWEAAFVSLPLDDPYVWDDNPTTDLTLSVGANSYTRGRNTDLDAVEAGTGQLVLLDDEGNYDPRNIDGPNYPNVLPIVPIRQTAVLDGVTYPLCQQFVERWPRDPRRGAMTTRSLTTVDAFRILAQAGLAGLSISSDTTGVHVDAVLDHIGWPAGRRAISPGAVVIAAASWGDTDSTTPLSYLQAVAFNEAGLFFIDGAGNAVFLDQTALLGSPYNSVAARFTDSPADGAIPYVRSVPTFDVDRVVNDFTGTRAGGSPQNSQDADSIDRYGPISKQYTMLLTTDGAVLSAMDALLGTHREPLERLESITVIPGEDSTIWATLLGLELGDRIAVTDTPREGASYTDDYLIQRLSLQRAAGSDAGAAFTFALSPVVPSAGVIFDDPVFDRMDENKMGW